MLNRSRMVKGPIVICGAEVNLAGARSDYYREICFWLLEIDGSWH
jgi:hypothetical protein